jgi:hypothetical protein
MKGYPYTALDGKTTSAIGIDRVRSRESGLHDKAAEAHGCLAGKFSSTVECHDASLREWERGRRKIGNLSDDCALTLNHIGTAKAGDGASRFVRPDRRSSEGAEPRSWQIASSE